MAFQSSFMLTTVQLFATAIVQRLVERADVRVAIVGPLALGVGVVDEQRRRRGPLPAAVHCEHLQVAVGVAEGRDRPAADEVLDPDGLAVLVVDEVDARVA